MQSQPSRRAVLAAVGAGAVAAALPRESLAAQAPPKTLRA
jgi:hypothetical protein